MYKIDWSKYHVNKIDGDSVTQMFDKMCPEDVHPSVTQKLNSILSKYHALFEYRIGTINGFQANIHLKPDSTPKFMKSRSIPFALQEAVSQELDRLIENKILQPIPFSDWASPIVIIPEPDGGLRICGDFKATVNLILNRKCILLLRTTKYSQKYRAVNDSPRLIYAKPICNLS